MISSANFEKSVKPMRYFSDNEQARRLRTREQKERGRVQNKHRKEVRSVWKSIPNTETL